MLALRVISDDTRKRRANTRRLRIRLRRAPALAYSRGRVVMLLHVLSALVATVCGSNGTAISFGTLLPPSAMLNNMTSNASAGIMPRGAHSSNGGGSSHGGGGGSWDDGGDGGGGGGGGGLFNIASNSPDVFGEAMLQLVLYREFAVLQFETWSANDTDYMLLATNAATSWFGRVKAAAFALIGEMVWESDADIEQQMVESHTSDDPPETLRQSSHTSDDPPETLRQSAQHPRTTVPTPSDDRLDTPRPSSRNPQQFDIDIDIEQQIVVGLPHQDREPTLLKVRQRAGTNESPTVRDAFEAWAAKEQHFDDTSVFWAMRNGQVVDEDDPLTWETIYFLPGLSGAARTSGAENPVAESRSDTNNR